MSKGIEECLRGYHMCYSLVGVDFPEISLRLKKDGSRTGFGLK